MQGRRGEEGRRIGRGRGRAGKGRQRENMCCLCVWGRVPHHAKLSQKKRFLVSEREVPFGSSCGSVCPTKGKPSQKGVFSCVGLFHAEGFQLSCGTMVSDLGWDDGSPGTPLCVLLGQSRGRSGGHRCCPRSSYPKEARTLAIPFAHTKGSAHAYYLSRCTRAHTRAHPGLNTIFPTLCALGACALGSATGLFREVSHRLKFEARPAKRGLRAPTHSSFCTHDCCSPSATPTSTYQARPCPRFFALPLPWTPSWSASSTTDKQRTTPNERNKPDQASRKQWPPNSKPLATPRPRPLPSPHP